ncbi:ATP-binding protein [Candidatus Pelagibacter sp.]|jgi:anti-sigma regulatory factor (Ser/Thr protein kinase)|nr:ATP-binding protein [Candidatus Pelagibacter sp.]MDC0875396.1 ATP-binding protein [Candidatus Pelagibacter sp.]MDC1496962.1 ATP-binding protein [Pelagibacteraceae bacterium]|tara:strand:- start:769 stop:1179 length:411 start_codon:yes stop_codon:yes gene_type:complete
MNLEEEKDFKVESSSLKEIRSFAREVISKSTVLSACSDDLVLALAEAAQNIVKHAYNGQPTDDLLKVKISFKDNDLSMELFDKGKPVVPANIKPRNLEDIKAGGLGTFFIGQIMDEVVFKTTKVDWVNHLVLTKKF